MRATLRLKPNPAAGVPAPLKLDGDGITLVSLKLDGETLAADRYMADARRPDHPAAAASCRSRWKSKRWSTRSANTQLSGLYRSSDTYCTQCEAEGFRRITYFPDRPDVMAIYTTRIEADKVEAPVLLANGNLIEQRRPAGRPTFRRLARPVAEAVLSVRHGRRQARLRRGQLRHHVRPQRCAAHLCRARQGRPLRLRHGLAQARHALGRGGVRPRIRSRRVHDRGGDPISTWARWRTRGSTSSTTNTCSPRPRPRPTRTSSTSKPSSRTNISTTGPATASPAATGSSFA